MPQVSVESNDALRFCGGQAVQAPADGQEGLVRVYEVGQQFLGVGELSGDGVLSPRRVFLTQEKTS
jgi:hypothetical protein